MSFSSNVKEEIACIPFQEDYSICAEILAALIFSNHTLDFSNQQYDIEFHSEHYVIVERFARMIHKLCGFEPMIEIMIREAGESYILQFPDANQTIRLLKTVRLLNDMGMIDEERMILDNPLLQIQECKRAFIRGAFLVAGSITDPNKNYHFEISCTTSAFAYQLQEVLESFGLEPKIVLRKKYYVVYVKEGSMISDLLSIMEAHKSMMEFENIRIFKDVRNSVNRRVNCETANINKSVFAGHRQKEDIEYIQKTIGLDKLPPSLRDIALARLENPGMALKELGEMLDPPVGKSGVNHRLRRLSQMAQKLKEQHYL